MKMKAIRKRLDSIQESTDRTKVTHLRTQILKLKKLLGGEPN